MVPDGMKLFLLGMTTTVLGGTYGTLRVLFIFRGMLFLMSQFQVVYLLLVLFLPFLHLLHLLLLLALLVIVSGLLRAKLLMMLLLIVTLVVCFVSPPSLMGVVATLFLIHLPPFLILFR